MIRIFHESEDSLRLDDVATVKVNDPDADFWIVRRGTAKQVGAPTREFNPEHFGITVKRLDVFKPDYLFYVMMHLHMRGHWRQNAIGTTRLVSIRAKDVRDLVFGS